MFSIAALLFVISGTSYFFGANLTRSLLWFSAVFSTFVLVMFWDGHTDMLVQKGILGVVLNMIIALVTIQVFLEALIDLSRQSDALEIPEVAIETTQHTKEHQYFQITPIGCIVRDQNRVLIKVMPSYQLGLKELEHFSHV